MDPDRFMSATNAQRNDMLREDRKARTREEYEAAFLAAVRGIPTDTVGKAMTRHSSGVNWRGCTKAHMAEEYGRANTERNPTFRILASPGFLELMAATAKEGHAAKITGKRLQNAQRLLMEFRVTRENVEAVEAFLRVQGVPIAYEE